MLYWLFTDSIEETIGKRTFGYRYDPGADEGCADVLGRQHKCFRDLIDIAFMTGLTVESKAIEKTGGAGADKKAAAPQIYSRFCFDPIESRRARRTLPPEEVSRLSRLIWSQGHLPLCKSAWDPVADAKKKGSAEYDTLEFNQPNTPVGPVHYRIVTRSTFGIYQFLGKLLDNQVDTAFLSADQRDVKLLTVTRDSAPDCFEVVGYTDGAYCVPDGARNTKQILQLLAQLLALQTQTIDLAITPTVRVTP